MTDRLLRIDETHHPAGRRDLLKADIVATFSSYFEVLSYERELQARILDFVNQQRESPSPKTRAAAKAFRAARAG